MDETGVRDYSVEAALDDVYVGDASPCTSATKRWRHLVRKRRDPSPCEEHAIGEAWLSQSSAVVKLTLAK